MSRKRVRARSPLPDWVANISPTDLQAKLGKKIPDGALSVTDRFKRYWGVGTVNYHPDKDALRDAMYEFYDNSTAEQRAEAKLKAVDQIATVKENIDKLNRYNEPYASNAEINRGNFPREPITSDEIAAQQRYIQHLKHEARAYNYIENMAKAQQAEKKLKDLNDRFNVQKREFPGAEHLEPVSRGFVFGPPPHPHRSGGKSKRVKRSKRSKTRKNRVHKRRN